MNVYEFIISYKKNLTCIEQLVQPQFLKYTHKLSKIKPWFLINSKTTFNSEFESLGFVLSLILKMYHDDINNISFDDDENLLYADHWFIQAMNLEFGKTKSSYDDKKLVWKSDMANVLERKDIMFKIEVISDYKTKSIIQIVVSGYKKKSKEHISSSMRFFLGNSVDDILADIYDMAESIIEDLYH